MDEKRTIIVTRYKIDRVEEDLLKQLLTQLDATLVRTFVHGVHPTLGAHLQVLKIQNLNDARSKLINDCSIILTQLKHNSTFEAMNKLDVQKFKPNFNIPNFKPNFNQQPPKFQPPTFQQQPKPFNNFNNFNQYRPQFQRSYQQPQFQQNSPKWNSQNTVSMRSVQPQRQYNQHQNFPKWNSQNTVSMKTKPRQFISPYEITYLDSNPDDQTHQEFSPQFDEQPQTNEFQKLQQQINSLTENMNKLTDHFLERGHSPHSPPDENSN